MSTEQSDPKALVATVEAAAKLLNGSRKPVMLAGSKLRAYGAIDAFRELAEALGCGVAVMPDAKGFFPEDHPQFMGVYWGSVSSPGCEPVVNEADMILAAGPMYTDYSTEGWTALAPQERTINAYPGFVRFPRAEYSGVELADFLSSLAKQVRKNDATLVQYRNASRSSREPSAPAGDSNASLTRVEMVRQIQNDIDGKTTLLVETGDAWFDGMYMRLPGGARFEIEMLWGSIGWSVAATFGYALGLEPGRRIVSMIGDGSFRFTAQEVATMIGQGLKNITIFLINNHGYLVESVIHDGPYNYFKEWDYAGLVKVLNAGEGHGLGLKAKTGGELANAIKKAREHTGGPVLIECQLAHDDYSPKMAEWGKKVSKANSRPPQQA
jgi:pyruvate decarboxylase/indolepyruvate decarboxylase